MIADVQDKPTVSDRKRAANRANAAKSTGPRTEQGKARSRLNALTHGLRAEQVVLPHEDAAAFEAERAAFFDEWRPPTATRAVLVERLVADAWRLRRCVRVEGARLRKIAGEAADAFDAEVRADLDEAAGRLVDDPAWAVERLEGLRPGVDQLRSCWEGLVAVLAIEGEWKDFDRHHTKLCRLLGMRPETSPAELGDVAMASWTLMLTSDPALAEGLPWDDPLGELSSPYPPARAEKVRGLLLELAEREVRRLGELHGRLPDLGPIRDRHVEGCCFDPSKEAAALKRYEAMHDRSFRANLNLLIKLTQTGADLVEGSGPNEPNGAGAAVAIEGEPSRDAASGTQADEVGAPIEATEAPPAPDEPTGRRPRRAPRRDRGGRSWPSEAVGDAPDGR